MMSQTPTPISPVEQHKKDLATIQREINDLQSKVNLSSVHDKLEDLQSKVSGLSKRIADLRQKNYIFDTNLEVNAKEFVKKWQPIHANLRVKVNQEANQLKADLKPVEQKISLASSQLNNLAFTRQILDPIKINVTTLSKKVSASESLLRGLYNSFESDLNKFNKYLLNIEFSVKEFETSNIKFLAHEFLVMGGKCIWTKDGKKDKDDPEGILYLSDQRLIFEQKQEVATKKILFITKERELRQEILVDIPVRMIETVKTSKQGIFKNQDYLDLIFASGAQYSNAQFHLQNQDCEDWKTLINKTLSGDFDKNRIEQVDQEILDKVKNAPTICPQCSATINVQILRGMDQISCQFCGAIIKL
ncbi:MAG: hypothetical protein Q7U53_05460 [Anaerolineaceae bacterium]|nr:hypothetical protein [Anaerolineaceae bacterium]